MNPIIKSNNLLNNALAMQEAFKRGAFEGRDAELSRRAGRMHDREPVHRQGRRGADAAARRRACWRASRASSCSRWARSIGVPVREQVLRDEDLFGADEAFLTSTTRELVPIVRVDDRDDWPRNAGPVTKALLEAFRDAGARELSWTFSRTWR